MFDVKIRAYIKGDENQIVWLINNTWRTAYKDIFPSEIFEIRDKSAEDRIKSFNSSLIENNKICFVAEEDSKIVGVLVGELKTNIELFDKDGYARISILYIDKDFQRQKIGYSLFKSFVDELKKNNKERFVIGALKDNRQGRDAYERWGGVLTDYTEKFVVLDVSREEVFYEYDIKNINS